MEDSFSLLIFVNIDPEFLRMATAFFIFIFERNINFSPKYSPNCNMKLCVSLWPINNISQYSGNSIRQKFFPFFIRGTGTDEYLPISFSYGALSSVHRWFNEDN